MRRLCMILLVCIAINIFSCMVVSADRLRPTYCTGISEKDSPQKQNKTEKKPLSGIKIGINPGHQKKTIKTLYPIGPGAKKKAYGVKVGAVGRVTRVPEYATNLAVGLVLKDLLEEKGAKVVITRTSNDVSLTNIERTEKMNKAHVDVAIHLHCNGSHKKSRSGLCAYVMKKYERKYYEESKTIAKYLTKAMSEETEATNNGVKTSNSYMSLNYAKTPAVLLEMGYLSNEEEDNLLSNSEKYRKKMAKGIVKGLINYFNDKKEKKDTAS